MAATKDHYQTLGVTHTATEQEIKKAFRKLAQQFHPDKNPGDKESERRFKEVNEAYSVLSDSEKRSQYDRFGADWEQYARAGVSPDEWARYGFTGQPGGRSGQSRTMTQEEFEALFGAMGGMGGRGGAGAPGGDFEDGTIFDQLFGRSGQRAGRRTTSAQSGFGPAPQTPREVTIQVTLEEAFNGSTRMLQEADGKRIEVTIPRGVKTGSKVRVKGTGGVSDILLRVEVLPHATFAREEDALRLKLPVDLFTCVLGGEVQVPAIDRTVALTIPAGTQNGRVFRLRKLGMPHLRNPDTHGDLMVEVEVQLPTRLSAQERDLFEQLRALNAG